VAISSLRPLRSRNFALVWSAALVSNVGSWMQTVALGAFITVKTHDPLWTGHVAAEIERTRPKLAFLFDWHGTLSRDPWNLPARSSSVLVLDALGAVAFAHSGKLPPAKVEELFNLLTALLPADAHGPALGSLAGSQKPQPR
jgi:hypothetical protein